MLKCASPQTEVLVTGELGHHELLAASFRGQTVVLCEHSNTERGFLHEQLVARLQALLPDARVVVSTQDRDPIQIM